MTAIIYAQAPNKMSYQAVIRNSSNALVTDQSIGMQISILQGSMNGSSVYIETQTPTTNNNGLASIEIGSGVVVSGIFSEINWANGPYYCKIDTDPNGGLNYSITGTSQLLSVPYSLFSGNGIIGVSVTGDSLFLGNGTSLIIPGISEANNAGGQTGITIHTCGATNIHNPTKTYGSMTDQQGNVYKTIVIGSQEWMAENLKTSIYRNGNPIATNLNNVSWQNTINTQIGAWAYFNNDSLNECPYGKLYNWYAVADSRQLCPLGWHVPTDSEWNTLISFLDPFNDPNAIALQSLTAGAKMKSNYGLWMNNQTNESGFSALPGGQRFYDGQFYNTIQVEGNWWSSSEGTIYDAYSRSLNAEDGVTRYEYEGNIGFSVRCIRD
jgi:uncharacterized protein (TIGR02145 family)